MAVHFIPCGDWSREQWSVYRDRGLGASDIGTVMGKNKYQSALELWHLKIGRSKPRPMSLRMNIGHLSEPLIADLWEYWIDDKVKFNENVTNRTKVRHCEDLKAYAHNDKYPNLFVSLDRVFKDKRFGDQWCNLELKNKTSLSYKQFTDKMNPVEVLQLSTQQIVTEYPYGEIAYFIDNVEMEVLPITLKDAKRLEKPIIETVNTFWKSVEKGRVLVNQIDYAKRNYQMKLAGELEMELLQLEPLPEDTEAYMDYLTELARNKITAVPIKGDEEMLAKARKLLKNDQQRKKLEQQRLDLQSDLAHAMRSMDKYEIDFGKNGKVSLWNGRFKNMVK